MRNESVLRSYLSSFEVPAAQKEPLCCRGIKGLWGTEHIEPKTSGLNQQPHSTDEACGTLCWPRHNSTQNHLTNTPGSGSVSLGKDIAKTFIYSDIEQP